MIIYLHGFNSSGASAKGQFLREQLDDITVLTPTYHYDPSRAIIMLQHLVEESLRLDRNLLLAGASLGGYYAQYLGQRYALKRVLINPALMPLATLESYLGENVNYYTGERYTLTTRHLDALRALDVPHPCIASPPTLLLLDKDDELLDYRLADQRYDNCADIRLFDGGDHAFQHLPDALPAIRGVHARPWPDSGTDSE
ncbi:MAG: YqiA/YcfP family alpha/beta fold hydrolase [Thiohalophilus sp.]|uniref:YqiA/YcfP family alpha/beta fold hydrolase n=1 Tax=Thiohalophilus sp. TaxID=3028392 RepID=UPI00286FF59F|nr:YqiA/YcfP family alpha/beta fold hydrolase [Thiohalophilus sp.]MDR9436138.1 YqiA/YcfP family alpha/beta fold hydrolase [Thiohalophilus sp.]